MRGAASVRAAKTRAHFPRRSNIEFGLAFGTGNQKNRWDSLSTSDQNTWIALFKSIGLKWVRLTIGWSTVQPSSGGAISFTEPDKSIVPLLAAGFNVLAVLFEPPLWARPCVSSPSLISAWESYVAQSVQHYSPMGVHAYEIWNEPNQLGDKQAGWGIGKVRAFATLMETGVDTILANDPAATIVMAGVCPVNDPSIVTSDQRAGCSWPTQAAGAATLAVTSTNAQAADFTPANPGSSGGQIPGNYVYHALLGGYCPVVAATDGVGWTLGPPGEAAAWPAVTAHSNQVVNMLGTFMAPDYMVQYTLAKMAEDGRTDIGHKIKVGWHPYSTPKNPMDYGLNFKGWTLYKTLTGILDAAGFPEAQIWVTECGQNTGWPTATAAASAALGAATMTVKVSEPNSHDVGYNIISTSGNSSASPKSGGIPTGTTVTAVNVGTSTYTLAAPGGSFPAAVTVTNGDQLVIYDGADGVPIGVAMGSTEAQQATTIAQLLDTLTGGTAGTADSGRYSRVQVLMPFQPVDSTDGHFGLWRYDLTAKPAVQAVQARIPGR